jgi:hypothetical protein
MTGEDCALIDYLRWAELHIYMTVHKLSLTRTRRSGQGLNRYNFSLLYLKLRLMDLAIRFQNDQGTQMSSAFRFNGMAGSSLDVTL